jgi:hypothetical protein
MIIPKAGNVPTAEAHLSKSAYGCTTLQLFKARRYGPQDPSANRGTCPASSKKTPSSYRIRTVLSTFRQSNHQGLLAVLVLQNLYLPALSKVTNARRTEMPLLHDFGMQHFACYPVVESKNLVKD